MRWPVILGLIWLLIVAGGPQFAIAQDIRLGPLKEHLATTFKRPQTQPTAASGFAPAAPQNALPKPSNDPRAFTIIRGENVQREGSRVQADGGVEFLYRGYRVIADRIDGNLDTRIFVLNGNVIVKGLDQDIKGDRAVVNLKERTFAYDDATAVLGPSATAKNLLAPLYLKGKSGRGSAKQSWLETSEFTTCDKPEPHFHLDSASADYKPGRRLILRHTSLEVLGHKLLTLPYLLIPLTEDKPRYTPEFGQSRDEGYYVKNSIGTPLHGDDSLMNKIDYFTKLGLGLGTDWRYDNGEGTYGLARAYQLTGGAKSTLFSVDHRMQALGGDFKIDGSWIKNNYLTAPDTRYYNFRGLYNARTRNGTLRLSATRGGNKTRAFSSINQIFGLEHQEKWSRTLRTNLNADMTENRSGSESSRISRRVANVRFGANQDLNKAEAELSYQRAIPIGAQQGFFSSSDQTPMVTISSDARRLMSSKSAQAFPFRTELSVGELKDSVTRREITRTTYSFDVAKDISLPRDSKWNYALRFKQGLYSDDTAQYVMGGNLGWRWSIAKKTYIGMRYEYLRPEGYTPLSVDRSGNTNMAYGEIQYQPHRTLVLSAQSAYDFLQIKQKRPGWQTVGLRSEWEPNDKFRLRSNAQYDSFRQVWSNVRFDLGWKVSQGFVSLGTRFDGERHTWGNFNLLADGITWKRLKASVAVSYNGYTKQFEARHLSLTYDLHCAEAILQIIDNPVGFRKGTEISFFIRLKALPFDTPFGFGRRGQAVGSGAGAGF